MKHTLVLLAAVLLARLDSLHAADTFLVQDRQPHAKIVLHKDAISATKLARPTFKSTSS